MKKIITGAALLAVSSLSLAANDFHAYRNVHALIAYNTDGGKIMVTELGCTLGEGAYTAATDANTNLLSTGCAQEDGDSIVVHWSNGSVKYYSRENFRRGIAWLNLNQ